MLNTMESYIESAVRTSRARRHHDQGSVDFERRWYTRALALETLEDRRVIEDEYRRAYREESGL